MRVRTGRIDESEHTDPESLGAEYATYRDELGAIKRGFNQIDRGEGIESRDESGLAEQPLIGERCHE